MTIAKRGICQNGLLEKTETVYLGASMRVGRNLPLLLISAINSLHKSKNLGSTQFLHHKDGLHRLVV